ncbi:MAG: hypothetical protein CENE_02640 [Candidatus Celerinatantimonas neptuna]|nr:MAG: hypothetical protein CENE_02640 [Candidatus Celerinatantimonas neptuna]
MGIEYNDTVQASGDIELGDKEGIVEKAWGEVLINHVEITERLQGIHLGKSIVLD